MKASKGKMKAGVKDKKVSKLSGAQESGTKKKRLVKPPKIQKKTK